MDVIYLNLSKAFKKVYHGMIFRNLLRLNIAGTWSDSKNGIGPAVVHISSFRHVIICIDRHTYCNAFDRKFVQAVKEASAANLTQKTRKIQAITS